MKNKTQILEIPRKDTFGNKDNDEWKLSSVDFFPFTDLEDYAKGINMVREILVDLGVPSHNRESVEEIMQWAKSFACSTIILDSSGKCQRVFFESPKDLENFLINYKE
jgi:hypothetical protein